MSQTIKRPLPGERDPRVVERLESGEVLVGREAVNQTYHVDNISHGEATTLQLRNIIKEVRAHKPPRESPSFRLIHGGLTLIRNGNGFAVNESKDDLDELIHFVEKNAERFGRLETQRERAERERRRGGNDWTAELLKQLDRLLYKVGELYYYRSPPENIDLTHGIGSGCLDADTSWLWK